jgi:hypothetical protein
MDALSSTHKVKFPENKSKSDVDSFVVAMNRAAQNVIGKIPGPQSALRCRGPQVRALEIVSSDQLKPGSRH